MLHLYVADNSIKKGDPRAAFSITISMYYCVTANFTEAVAVP
jgi:hypothetical protein